MDLAVTPGNNLVSNFNPFRNKSLHRLHREMFKMRQIAVAPRLQTPDGHLSHKLFHSICGDQARLAELLDL
jgi:hypothetical protein